MNYIAITNEEALYHHGVKGMKWGVRRYNPFKRGGGKQARYGSVLAYEKRNKKGVSKQRRVRIGAIDRVILKKKGFVNKDGSVTTTDQKKAVKRYAEGKRKMAIASAAVTAAIATGQAYIRYRRSTR